MSSNKEIPLTETPDVAQWVRHTSTFESFKWEEAPSLDRKVFDQLASFDFIQRGQDVVFSGPIACGKTHLANALSDLALKAGYTVNHVNGHRLDARFSWQSCLETYLVDSDLLIIDEPRPTEQLRTILQHRSKRATLFVTYEPAAKIIAELLSFRHDPQSAPMRDRLPQPAADREPIVVEFKENSYGLSLRRRR